VTTASGGVPAGVRARGLHSLGGRLSVWLALQGLFSAVAVSVAVFAVNAWVLQSRQHEELDLKQLVVRHALVETGAQANRAELKHRLDDFLAGHEDMSVSVASSSGDALYPEILRRRPDTWMRVKTVAWEDQWPTHSGGRVKVVLGLDVGRDDELLLRLGATLLGASLLGAAVVSATGFLLVRRGLRPVRELSAQVEAVALDRLHLRLDSNAQPTELSPLVDRFNALLARVERAYAQLEAFNADVAHELRTPLTTLIGASELALQRERPAQELREVIAANLEDLRRLAGIVNDMLFLSQADRGAPARRTQVDSLSAAFVDILDYHDAALQERSLTAACEGDGAGAYDVALLRRAVSNLLSNAGRYAAPGSVIRVRIDPRPGGLRLAVSNEGHAIAPEHLPRLFDRFYRVERSRQQEGSNYGLGLAIVAAIARMHGGEPFAVCEAGITTIGMDIPEGTQRLHSR
jgi:two-component system heavy metal sensor histidine kinase CusS